MRRAISCFLFSAALYAADSASGPASKAETFLLVPEPRVMGSAISRPFAGSRHTVFSPFRQTADGKLHRTTREEFAKLGLGWDSFVERAQAAADRRLAALQPDLKKNSAGKVLYAVYRSDEPTMACLLIAPSLAIIFKNILGEEVWLVSPDRHSLFVLPARKEALEEFADDLLERFEENPFAVSDEVFAVKQGEAPRVVASLTGAR